MHIFGAPNWLASFGHGPEANARTWAREVRWYDDEEALQNRFRRSVENCWDPTGEKTIARMDEAGVDASVMMPMDHGLMVNDEGVIPIERKNELCAELTQRHKGRLYSFCGVDPRRPNAAEILRHGLDELGMKGLKLYPTTGFYPDDPIVHPLYRTCIEFGVPVLLHQGHSAAGFKSKYGHPMYTDAVAADFPDLQIILGHGGRIETWGHEAISVAIYKPNTYIDISLWQHWLSVDQLLEKIVFMRDRIGIERVLFASDMTNIEVSLTLKEWVDVVKSLPEWAKQHAYRLSKQEIDLLLGGNAERLYRLDETG
jgi:predicted TIM-barrel fold metal-dependent hydrolase